MVSVYMKAFYLILVITLIWSYCKAMGGLRDVRLPLSPIAGWMIGLGYFTVIPLTILVLNGGYSIPEVIGANELYASVDLSSSRYVLPVIVVWLSLLLTFLTVIVFAPLASARDPAGVAVTSHQTKAILLLTVGLSFADYVFTVYVAGGIGPFLLSHWYLRQDDLLARFGDAYALYCRVSLANQILFTAAAALYVTHSLRTRRVEWWLVGTILGALIAQLAMSGNRIFIALFGFACLTSCWVYRRNKVLVALLLASPFLFVIFSAWAYVRHDLTSIAESVSGYAQQDLGNRTVTTVMDATEGSSVMILLHMQNDFGTRWDYLYGMTYTKVVTFALPRSIYPHKSDNFPLLLAGLYEPGETTSLGATQLGELYANFGPLCVVLLPCLTAAVMLASHSATLRNGHPLVMPVLFLLSLFAIRTSLEDSVITVVVAMALLWGLRLGLTRRHSGRSARLVRAA
jgi:hypothetical protein